MQHFVVCQIAYGTSISVLLCDQEFYIDIFSSEDYTAEAKALTDQYNRSVPEQNVDFHLLHDLLYYIYSEKSMGGILVFLTGYEDIVSMKDRILYDKRFDKSKIIIVTLHSMMQMSEQSAVFANVKDKRKIVLATNIAETSVTIEDIVYVVDAGKCKEKSYDSVSFILKHLTEKSVLSKLCYIFRDYLM